MPYCTAIIQVLSLYFFKPQFKLSGISIFSNGVEIMFNILVENFTNFFAIHHGREINHIVCSFNFFFINTYLYFLEFIFGTVRNVCDEIRTRYKFGPNFDFVPKLSRVGGGPGISP